MEITLYLFQDRLPYVRELPSFVSEGKPDEKGLTKVTLLLRNNFDAYDLFAAGILCGVNEMKQEIK